MAAGVEHLSSAGEAEFFGNGDEVAQIAQIHPGSIIATVSFCPAEFEFPDSKCWPARVRLSTAIRALSATDPLPFGRPWLYITHQHLT